MKIWLITCLMMCLLTIGQKQANHILIKHIGICDKPIWNILITEADSVGKTNRMNEYMLTQKNYVGVKNIILAGNEHSKPESDYGSFEIVITDSNKTTNIYLGRKKAMLLFHSLIELLEKKDINESLIRSLDTTIRRIDF